MHMFTVMEAAYRNRKSGLLAKYVYKLSSPNDIRTFLPTFIKKPLIQDGSLYSCYLSRRKLFSFYPTKKQQ